MTNYNEILDEQLNYLMEYSHKYGKGKIPSSENPPLIIARQAKQALTSLIKELVAEAKPKTMPSNLSQENYEKCERVVNQYHQNILKALEEV